MTAGFLLVVLVTAFSLWYVLSPMLRRDALEMDGRPRGSLDELRELHARQQMLLASLKDLEDDRATDKIGDEDYEQLKSKLTAQAIEVMQQLDVAEKDRDERLEQAREASRPLQYPSGRRPDPAP
jgi:hypothetical protein